MDYLDEETLLWDEQDQSLSKGEESQSATSRVPVSATQQQVEFLNHFDKAENQLINISSHLLALTLKVSTLPEPDDLTTLRQEIVSQINDVKTKGAELSYPVAVIDKLCFLYAVVIDEFVIYTEWGEKRGWENKTLLSELFGMRNGGELFFTVAEKATRQPHKLIDLLEVIYLFLTIGFKGQYRENGSDQLKSFTYNLEQTMTQYRQPAPLHCKTKVKLPKFRAPTRRKRYLITTLFFSSLIAMSIGLTHYWYNNTHDQRARDFAVLPDFSQRYVLSGQVDDIVFISSDTDLEVGPVKGSKVEILETPPPSSFTTSQSGWLVQLATFSSEANAQNFINSLDASNYTVEVDQINQYYRAIVRTSSSQEATEIKSWFVDHSSVTPIIVKNSSQSSSKEESN